MKSLKNIIVVLGMSFLCSSCHPNPYYHGDFMNQIEFGSYEELMNDCKKEDELKLKAGKDKWYTNYPSFDASLDGAISVRYFKYGLDRSGDFYRKKNIDDIEIHTMMDRWIYILNEFEDKKIYFAFYNWQNKEESNYVPNSFEWNEIKNSEDFDLLDNSSDHWMLFSRVHDSEKEQTHLYEGSKSFKLIDSNNNRLVTIHILSHEDGKIVLDSFKDFIVENCKEMIL